MNEQATQPEIKAIQERLQAMRAGHHAPRTPPASLMVEMFPNRLAPANRAGNPSLAEPAADDTQSKTGRELDIEQRSPSARAGSRPDLSATAAPSSVTGEMRSPAVTTVLRHALPASTETSQRRRVEPMRETAPTQIAEQGWTADSRMADSRMADARMADAKPSSVTVSKTTTAPKTTPASTITERSQYQAALKRLEAKAQQINQLSAAQETAMLELKAIATRLERDRVALELQHGDADERGTCLPAEPSTICEYLATSVPAIERDQSGAFVMTMRAVDLFKAERDAELMAQTLRHRHGTTPTRHRRTPQPTASVRAGGILQSLWKQLQAIATEMTESSTRSSRRARMAQIKQYAPSYTEGYSEGYGEGHGAGYGENYAGDYAPEPSPDYSSRQLSSEVYHYAQGQSQGQSQSHSQSQSQGQSQRYSQGHSQDRSPNQSPASNSLSYKASAIWLGGAIIARIAANLVLAAYPGFWIPVVGLMVAPAAIAVYRTTVAPQSSMIWGYRLFLVMMGLLVGGRLV